MGRRPTYDPVHVRQEAAKQLRTLLSAFDLAEVQAQTYAVAMVDMIAAMALNPNIVPEDLPVLRFRSEQAQIILARAYGQPATKATVTVHQAQDLAPDGKIAADIEAATRAAEEFREIDRCLQMPYETWPEWIKERFAAAQSPYLAPPAA